MTEAAEASKAAYKSGQIVHNFTNTSHSAMKKTGF
jgi:hypothetical protein